MDSNNVAVAPDVDRAQIIGMAEEVVRMLRQVQEAFHRLDSAPLDSAEKLGRHVHEAERQLTRRLVQRAGPKPGNAGAEEAIFVPMHLERIGDNIEFLGRAVRSMLKDGVLFTDRAMREVRSLFDLDVELLEGLRDALRTGNRTLVRYILEEGRTCETRANEYALFHEQRLIEGVCVPRASSLYLAMLDYLKGIEWHAREIAEKLTPVPVEPGRRGDRRMPSAGEEGRL